MLRTKQKKMAMSEGIMYCGKCKAEMKETTLSYYEFEQGLPLRDVIAMRCVSCYKVTFTERQAKEMKARTEEAKQTQFSFERKLTTSGKSLVIGVPHELAEHLRLKPGKKVKIFPLENEGFIVRKIEA